MNGSARPRSRGRRPPSSDRGVPEHGRHPTDTALRAGGLGHAAGTSGVGPVVGRAAPRRPHHNPDRRPTHLQRLLGWTARQSRVAVSSSTTSADSALSIRRKTKSGSLIPPIVPRRRSSSAWRRRASTVRGPPSANEGDEEDGSSPGASPARPARGPPTPGRSALRVSTVHPRARGQPPAPASRTMSATTPSRSSWHCERERQRVLAALARRAPAAIVTAPSCCF